ncbi:hypothetical protein IWW49_004850 [Coemansia sp. RSA 1797]|nr:hypothetical protein IWW49_004850 [Coemansia sp. RSA 1797]
MGTCADQLRSASDETHAQTLLSTTKRVLYLRTTTQIDELMQYASVAIQQRWDFLGPATDPSMPPNTNLFEQIDNALQWTANHNIGEHIRHAHFALELTEDQAEVVCARNLRYYFVDRETAHAVVPFAMPNAGEVYVIELVWEDGKWAYFDAKAVDKLTGFDTIAEAIDNASTAFPDHDGGNDDGDDDYWGQYSEDEADDDTNDRNPEPTSDYAAKPEPVVNPSQLISDSIRHALAAAASAAKAVGMSEPEFLELAADSFK